MNVRTDALARDTASPLNQGMVYPLHRVFMFGGQGCHYYQMASHLFLTHSTFREAMLRLDLIGQRILGKSVIAEIYRKDKSRSDDFSSITFTHPSIVMVQLALISTLAAEGITADSVIGTSLGEFIAACVAGAISDTDLLAAICDQALLIEQFAGQGKLPKGGMLSALITPDERDALLAEFPEVAVAGVHHSRHVTFSGDTWVIDALEKSCQQRAFLYQRIAVDYAFHSPAIRPLKAASLASIKKYTTWAFTLPFYSCATVARCRVIDAEHFWGIVESPINFADTIDLIEASATGATPVYVDLSPSGSLHGFVKQHLGAFRAKQVPVSLTLMSLMSNDTTQYQAGVLTLKRLAKAYSESAIAQPGPQDTTLVNHSMEKTRTSVVGNNPAKNTALVFPGQASQRVGMGRELFERFRRQTEIASDILGYSIEQLCLEDPQKQLNKTQYTQPALYTVCALQYLAYREDNEVVIEFLAGHSLGEYAALFAADVFDFETGLRIVKHRGELMSSANAGSMAVILNYKAQDLQQLLNDNGITSIDIANINSPDQLVIAGPHQALEAFEGIINSLAGTYIPIPVGAPFHSRYMQPIAQDFERFLEPFTFRPMNKTVISNVTGLPHQNEMLKNQLVKQLYSPVQWLDSVRYLMGLEVDEYVEIGPGDVLTKLTTKIRNKCSPLVLGEKVIRQVPGSTESVESKVARQPAKDGLGKAFKSRWSRGDEFSSYFGLAYPHVLTLSEDNLDYSFIERAQACGHLAFQAVPWTAEAIDSGSLDSILSRLGAKRSNDSGCVGVAITHSENDKVLFSKVLAHQLNAVALTGVYGMTTELVYYRVISAYQGRFSSTPQKNKLFIRVDDPRCVQGFYQKLPQGVLERLHLQGRIDATQFEFAKNIAACDAIILNNEEHDLEALMGINRLRVEHPELDIKIGIEGALSAPNDFTQGTLSQIDFFVSSELNVLIGESFLPGLIRQTLFSASDAFIVDLPDPKTIHFGGRAKTYITNDPAIRQRAGNAHGWLSDDQRPTLCRLLPSNYLAISEWLKVQFVNKQPSLAELSSALLNGV